MTKKRIFQIELDEDVAQFALACADDEDISPVVENALVKLGIELGAFEVNPASSDEPPEGAKCH